MKKVQATRVCTFMCESLQQPKLLLFGQFMSLLSPAFRVIAAVDDLQIPVSKLHSLPVSFVLHHLEITGSIVCLSILFWCISQDNWIHSLAISLLFHWIRWSRSTDGKNQENSLKNCCKLTESTQGMQDMHHLGQGSTWVPKTNCGGFSAM